MKNISYNILFALFFLAFHSVAEAQTSAEKKYALRAQEVEDELSGLNDPMFAANAVPEKYTNASAVVIAKKVELFSDLKSKMKFSIFYGANTTNNIRYTLTIREKIKIQDKHALEEYSEFSFSRIRNQSSFFKSKTNVFLGITLIKPDGTRKKIDVDEEAVNTESEDEKDRYKLALPGLQVGDIIDMYSRVEKESSEENPIEPLDLVIGGSYPIVNHVFKTKIRKDFAIIYSTANGATEPKETRDDEFSYLTMESNNIDKAAENLWVYDRRELPMFKINIIPGNASKNRKAKDPQKGQVLKGLSREWIDSDISTGIIQSFFYASMTNERITWLKEYIKRTNTERRVSRIDPDTLIHKIYYYGRYSYLYDYLSETNIAVGRERNTASTNYNFYTYLLGALQHYNISYDIIFTVPRSVGTIHTAVSADDFAILVRAKGKKDYYLIPPRTFTNANTLPYQFEGQDAYVYSNTSLRETGSRSVVEKLPATKATYNYMEENLQLSIDPANFQKVNIQRTKTVRGNLAYDQQSTMALFEDYVDKERIRLGERNLSDETIARVGKKRGVQLLDEYKQAFAVARKEREEYLTAELKNTFENPAVSLQDFKILQTGNRYEQRDFIFNEKFSIDGLLKKAGNNYILDLSTLITAQVQVKPEQRVRNNNIHMSYARTYNYLISIQIPEGYTAEGVEQLSKKVENETGSFTGTAKVENGKIVISSSKVYNKYFEDAANWNKMLEFLDAAYDFSQQKILIKKK